MGDAEGAKLVPIVSEVPVDRLMQQIEEAWRHVRPDGPTIVASEGLAAHVAHVARFLV